MTSPVADITIAGAGPAGLALAARAAERGARVVVVDPTPEAGWPNRYGAWERDAAGLGLPIAQRWSAPLVDLGQGPQRLPGTYVKLDGPALRVALLTALQTHGGRLLAGRVIDVEHRATDSRLTLADGSTLRTRRVVDATGRGVLVRRSRDPRTFQSAAGRLLRAQHPWSPDQAVYMDFSADHLSREDQGRPATFLYALPVDADTVFVEETSLAAAPAVPLRLLDQRLDQRLDALGIRRDRVLDTERCLFAMDAAPPERGRTLAVGAAAGWVHPATGYHLTRALHAADAVAHALVAHLDADPQLAAQRAWQAIWPAAELRTRALHDLGLGLLLDLDPAQIRTFFRAFFAIPEPRWRAYLDATSSPTQVAAAMSHVFATLPTSLQLTVARHALGRGRLELLRAVTPQPGGAS